MKELTERQEKIRKLYVNKKMTHKEIANELGVSRSNISVTLKRLRDNGLLEREAEIGARMNGGKIMTFIDGDEKELADLFVFLSLKLSMHEKFSWDLVLKKDKELLKKSEELRKGMGI